MVYQDPFASFNPKIKTGDSVKEIIELYKASFSVQELFSLVGLNHNYINKYPHELSGGEKQRLSIARVIASKPKIIIFDESLSVLDLDVQFSILNLIRFINKFLRVGIVFISHDISSVSYLCKRILVLKNGEIVDLFDSKNINSKNLNSYTKKLIQSANFKKMNKYFFLFLFLFLFSCKKNYYLNNSVFENNYNTVELSNNKYILNDTLIIPKGKKINY